MNTYMPIQKMRWWIVMSMLSLAVCLLIVADWEARLSGSGPGSHFRIRTYGATGINWQSPDPRLFRKRAEKDGVISVEYGFVSLRNDPLRIGLSVAVDGYDRYRQRFGYRKSETEALFKQQQDSLAAAYSEALRTHPSPEELQQVYAGIKKKYHQDRDYLFNSRGLRYLKDSVLAADIPSIVSTSVRSLSPVAVSLAGKMSRLGYGSSDIIATTLSMVQTAVAYSELPLEVDGRITAGFSPPLEVIMEGRGDCDAKSGLLAAILLNWDKAKLVGVGVPGHYLLGVLQHPGRGDAFVEFEGKTYVLMEPAGPALLPPGIVSDYTQKWLAARDQVIIEPLARN
jgi:hypothetical protein